MLEIDKYSLDIVEINPIYYVNILQLNGRNIKIMSPFIFCFRLHYNALNNFKYLFIDGIIILITLILRM